MFGKKKKTSEKDLIKAEKTTENIKKFLEIEAIHLREATSEEYDTNLNVLDKIRISNRIRQDDKQKKKNGIKRDFLDEVKDVSQITSDYKYNKRQIKKRSEYKEEYEIDQKYENRISSNDFSKNNYGERLIQESRLNMQNNDGIDVDKLIKNYKNKEKAEKAGCSIILAILSVVICFILLFVLP